MTWLLAAARRSASSWPLIWSVYALNQHAAARFGYEPFSLPNAAFMLVANLLLLAALWGLSVGKPAQPAVRATSQP